MYEQVFAHVFAVRGYAYGGVPEAEGALTPWSRHVVQIHLLLRGLSTLLCYTMACLGEESVAVNVWDQKSFQKAV